MKYVLMLILKNNFFYHLKIILYKYKMDNLFPKGYELYNIEDTTIYIGLVGSEMCSKNSEGENVIFHNTMYVIKSKNYDWDGIIGLQFTKDEGIRYYTSDDKEIFVYEEDEDEFDEYMNCIE